MGDTIRYPNMGSVKKAAAIYGLSPAYIPVDGSQTAEGIRRVAR